MHLAADCFSGAARRHDAGRGECNEHRAHAPSRETRIIEK
jgi:hypothetical protein